MFRISLAPQFVGREVVLRGWLYNKRSSGKIRFLIVRDGSGFMQAVMVKGEVPEEEFELFDELEQECALEVRGVVREEPRAPGGYELAVKGLKKLAPSPDYPIKKIGKGEKPPEVGWLLARRHLWIRSRKQWAILRVRAEVERAMMDFLDSEGFVRALKEEGLEHIGRAVREAGAALTGNVRGLASLTLSFVYVAYHGVLRKLARTPEYRLLYAVAWGREKVPWDYAVRAVAALLEACREG